MHLLPRDTLMNTENTDVSLAMMLSEVLGSLPTPLLVMDENLQVLYANNAAQQLVADQTPLKMRKLCGDVLQCVNALRPGACCGETEECPQCVIRQLAVRACAEQTALVGRAYIRREAATERYAHALVQANGIRHEGRPLVVLMLQDIPEIVEAAGLLRLCAWCHKVGEPDGGWLDLTQYLTRDLNLAVSHGMCPECFARWRVDLDKE
jgi:hypothetical protein